MDRSALCAPAAAGMPPAGEPNLRQLRRALSDFRCERAPVRERRDPYRVAFGPERQRLERETGPAVILALQASLSEQRALGSRGVQ